MYLVYYVYWKHADVQIINGGDKMSRDNCLFILHTIIWKCQVILSVYLWLWVTSYNWMKSMLIQLHCNDVILDSVNYEI